jgi:hypothetical protein
MLLIGLFKNISSLNLIKREILSSSVSVSNFSINIILIALREIKFKIKNLKLFFND